ncbi:MAG: lactate utilization protein C [Nostocoides sp.]
MSAREDILAGIRAGLGQAGRPRVPIDRHYRTPHQGSWPSGPDLLALFVERVEDYGATVTQCTDAQVTAVVAEAVAGARGVIVPADLDLSVPGAVVDDEHSAAQLDQIEAVVTSSAVGIAVTGTLVLDHGPGQGRRAITLVPDLHVCLVHAHQIVLDVPEAVDTLADRQPQTWISGGSATSDIELSRVEGVHGPRRLHVLLITPLTRPYLG